MVDIRAFRALRPRPDRAAEVAAPPYDVVDVAEARELAGGSRYSFLRVSRPEVDLPDVTDPDTPAVHAHGRAVLGEMVADGVLVLDDRPTLTVYRQTAGGRSQTGVACCVAVDDYAQGRVRIHEYTRPDKETDRVHHVDALDAHDEPVFLLAPPDATVAAVISEVVATSPDLDLTDPDGVRHEVWAVTDAERVGRVVGAYAAAPVMYVADGHHRSAAACLVRQQRRAEDRLHGGEDAFLAVVFATDQPAVLAYHRLVTDLGGLTGEQVLAGLREAYEVTGSDVAVLPEAAGEVGVYLAGHWYRLTVRESVVDADDPIGRLDVSILQDRVLRPLLGIDDPRRDPRIRFVGGSRGLAGLVGPVDAGSAAIAFAMPPTTVDELLAVADAGLVMPPKSTWFEPKLRSGLVVHPFGV